MKKLIVLRHSKSSWKDHSLLDYERPLNKRGNKDGKKIERIEENLPETLPHAFDLFLNSLIVNSGVCSLTYTSREKTLSSSLNSSKNFLKYLFLRI